MKILNRAAGVTAVVAAGMLLATLGPRDTNANEPTTGPSTKPVNAMCAVEPADKVDPAITYMYDGKLIGFCCVDCVPAFKKNPEKYMKNVK